MLEIRYVWEWPVRITHWINFLCIMVLSFTGFYIGHPFFTATSTAEYIMGWNRFLHFSFAYLFLMSVITRILWMFLGNRWASWRGFFPWIHKKGRQNAWAMFKYYTFISSKVPYTVGHNALAGIAYSVIYLLFLLLILTGFGMYSQHDPGGFWDILLGWFRNFFGNQDLRLAHHLSMWLLIAFMIHHVYSSWLMDVKERNGTLSGIFGGYKFVDSDEVEN